jgi:pilus assembly protein CpaE
MSAVLPKILLVLEDGIDASQIEEALPAGSRVTTTGLQHAGHSWAALRGPAADSELLVVGCAQQHAEVLDLVENASRQSHDRLPVVVLYHGSPNGFMEQAFAAGADDLITLPQPPHDLAFALEKAIARRRGGLQARREGSLMTVLGPKGGTGKTLTACNLAVALARHTAAPVIVDLDLQFGDVGLALGLKPERTIYDLATSGGSLDADKVDGFLATHESGVHALLAPVRPDQAAAVTPQFLRGVFEALRSRHEFVIVDTPPAFSPEVIASIDSATHLCVVGMLDALSLKDTKIGLETLAQMGYEPGDVTLVLNRADTSVGITQKDVEHLLGQRPDVLVPSDRAIPRAITEGRAIVEAAPRSGAAQAYLSLADKLAAEFVSAPVEQPEPAAKPRRSLLGIRGR